MRGPGVAPPAHHACLCPTPPPPLLQVGPFDRISIKGLDSFAPGKPLKLVGTRPDGSTYEFQLNHTFNANQVRGRAAGGLGRGSQQDAASRVQPAGGKWPCCCSLRLVLPDWPIRSTGSSMARL